MNNSENNKSTFTMVLAGVVSLGGVLTLGIVILALLFGLWLDRTLNVKPLFTILLMVFSAPLSIYVMYRVATNAIKKFAPPPSTKNQGDPNTHL